MRRSKKTTGIAACLSLLVLQFSGLHLHADEHGDIGGLATSYSDSHDHHGDQAGHGSVHGHGAQDNAAHHHDDVRDVALLDLTLSAFKLTLAVLVSTILLVLCAPARTRVSTLFAYPVLRGRHTRWRPPLRAPPAIAPI